MTTTRAAGGAPLRGLTHDEAAARLATHGLNTLPERAPPSVLRRFAAQFASPIIYILLVAVVFEVAVWILGGRHGLPIEGLAIVVILLANASLGVWQERKAESALARLRELAAPQVWALRDGRLRRIAARDVVPGDIVRLEAGDRVPADGVVGEGHHLTVDESIVTGESMPVEKSARDGALAGTLVATGLAWIEVTATGASSTMGRLATMLGDVRAEPTPLERQMQVFGHRVARWVLVLAGALALSGLAVEGLAHAGPVFLFAVALAVAAVPEGLPAVLTVTLALGVERMARRQAVVRKLAAVEALGSVTVVATDKTGTITENRMQVQGLDVTDEAAAMRAMALANDAEAGESAGDPVDHALLAHVSACGMDVSGLRGAFGRRSARPFDAAWRFARVSGIEEGEPISYLKGAPEVLLARSRLEARERARWMERLERHASAGFRLLAVARGLGETEDDLEWLGLVLLWDPPRAEVPAAIHAAQAAGIRVVMVTGDHPATAATVAAAVGIGPGGTLTGADLDALDAAGLRRVVRSTAVFARVAPEHKLRIVEALSDAGEIVAMTGDGVNDAPALKRAAVGVAMGQRGSDVSREVADLVLLDDNFATIVAAIEEGRSIYENVQKFIRFLFSTNFSEVLVVSLGAFAAFALGMREPTGGLLLPLTAAQLLWINLVTDGAPALALGVDRNPGVMRAPPRDPSSPLLDRRALVFIVLAGGAIAMLALGLLAVLPPVLGEPVEATRTAVFLFMAIGQVVMTYPARRTSRTPLPNPALHWTVAGSLLVQLVLFSAPTFREAFDVTLPSPQATAMVAIAVAAAWVAAHAIARRVWRG